MSKHLVTMAAGLVVLAGGAVVGAANACEPAGRKANVDEVVVFKKVSTIEWVTTTEKRREPYTREITLRDECGRTYRVEISGTREVEVVVRKPVPVEKWVKVSQVSSEYALLLKAKSGPAE